MSARLKALTAGTLIALSALMLPHARAGQPAGAQAESYPARPIRWVVPYPPGGPLDIVARVVGQKLAERLGQSVVIDNRAGAGGNIGADLVAKAPPDGHSIVMGAVATHAINVHLYARLPFDPIRDFAPVVLITQVPNILVVNPGLPAKSVKDLIALARQKPGALSFGSGSIGSAGHLAGELFKRLAGVEMVHVPYKGAAPAVADLLAGQVQLMFDNLASALPNVKAARLRALAVTTAKRSPQVPELPTIAEAGLAGFDVSTWFGIFASAGTPATRVDRLNREVIAILEQADVKERLALLGAEPAGGSPQAFAAFVRTELEKYGKVVRAAGAKVD